MSCQFISYLEPIAQLFFLLLLVFIFELLLIGGGHSNCSFSPANLTLLTDIHLSLLSTIFILNFSFFGSRSHVSQFSSFYPLLDLTISSNFILLSGFNSALKPEEGGGVTTYSVPESLDPFDALG